MKRLYVKVQYDFSQRRIFITVQEINNFNDLNEIEFQRNESNKFKYVREIFELSVYFKRKIFLTEQELNNFSLTEIHFQLYQSNEFMYVNE